MPSKNPRIPAFSPLRDGFHPPRVPTQRENREGAPAKAGTAREKEPSVNKNDLIQKLSDTTGLPKNDAAKAVDGVFDIIAATLKEGDEVRLTGFGVFVVATRAGGKGRNPQTGEEITIKPSRQPRFRAGKQLKDSLN
ncbi:MAG TPA: HU family DNA-binding protein [Rhizomicrobium sp.]|nr:HU family DNA-binding protein [Rhizomicrobium sp.]